MTLIALGIVLSYVIASSIGFVFAIFDDSPIPTLTFAAFAVGVGTTTAIVTLLVTLVVLVAAGDAARALAIVLSTVTLTSIASSIWVSLRL